MGGWVGFTGNRAKIDFQTNNNFFPKIVVSPALAGTVTLVTCHSFLATVLPKYPHFYRIEINAFWARCLENRDTKTRKIKVFSKNIYFSNCTGSN